MSAGATPNCWGAVVPALLAWRWQFASRPVAQEEASPSALMKLAYSPAFGGVRAARAMSFLLRWACHQRRA